MLLAAVQGCADVVVPQMSEIARKYYESGNILWIVQQFWNLAVPFLILVTGLSGKMGKVSQTVGRNWFFTLLIYLALFTCVTTLVQLPLDYYAGYVRQHAYDLSTQTLSRFFSQWGKSIGVGFVITACFLWIFYLLLKKSPKRWWLYGTFIGVAIGCIGSIVQPLWIDPLFHKFGPMQNKQLESQILNLAQRAHIQGASVFEVDMSSDTKMVNAYVTGIGKTRRIVLWDTTMDKLKPDEILFVMGHEMGHYVLHHIWWGLLFSAISLFITLYLTYRTSRFLLSRYHHRFGFHFLHEIASLPLLLMTFSFYQFLFMPIENVFSRTLEHNADIFGLEITQNNQAAGEAFIALQQENLANPRPGPLFVFWRSSHPPLGARVDFSNSYCPWVQGKPLKYGKYFTEN
jgi:STE24 endopeptidase